MWNYHKLLLYNQLLQRKCSDAEDTEKIVICSLIMYLNKSKI